MRLDGRLFVAFRVGVRGREAGRARSRRFTNIAESSALLVRMVIRSVASPCRSNLGLGSCGEGALSPNTRVMFVSYRAGGWSAASVRS